MGSEQVFEKGREQARRRRGTRITALVVGGIAIAIYAAFILSGVLRA